MNVAVVAEAQGGTTHQGAHVQRQDGDEQWLPALQVAVQQDGHKDHLWRQTGRLVNGQTDGETESHKPRAYAEGLGSMLSGNTGLTQVGVWG